jgi:signal transduction histidine kinase
MAEHFQPTERMSIFNKITKLFQTRKADAPLPNLPAANLPMANQPPANLSTTDNEQPEPVLLTSEPDMTGNSSDISTLQAENERLRKCNELLSKQIERKVQELTKANQSLAHTDTMKSRFINLAAHELRTPLAAVVGYLSVLTYPGSKVILNADEDTLKLIEGIATGIDRLQGLVQDMLDVTRIEAGKLQLRPAPTHLWLIFKKIKRDFSKVANKRRLTLDIQDTTDMPMMWADGERVTQILRNLMSNAVKYTPDGGTIRVTAEIEKSRDTNNTFVKITVSDTGVGVAKDQQERIFESLYEVKELELHSTSKTNFMGGGVGLGLPIARGVAEAHGGSLWVESPGHDPETCPGSKLHLILPLGKPPQS